MSNGPKRISTKWLWDYSKLKEMYPKVLRYRKITRQIASDGSTNITTHGQATILTQLVERLKRSAQQFRGMLTFFNEML
jgi:hypothetical protein